MKIELFIRFIQMIQSLFDQKNCEKKKTKREDIIISFSFLVFGDTKTVFCIYPRLENNVCRSLRGKWNKKERF